MACVHMSAYMCLCMSVCLLYTCENVHSCSCGSFYILSVCGVDMAICKLVSMCTPVFIHEIHVVPVYRALRDMDMHTHVHV